MVGNGSAFPAIGELLNAIALQTAMNYFMLNLGVNRWKPQYLNIKNKSPKVLLSQKVKLHTFYYIVNT